MDNVINFHAFFATVPFPQWRPWRKVKYCFWKIRSRTSFAGSRVERVITIGGIMETVNNLAGWNVEGVYLISYGLNVYRTLTSHNSTEWKLDKRRVQLEELPSYSLLFITRNSVPNKLGYFRGTIKETNNWSISESFIVHIGNIFRYIL